MGVLSASWPEGLWLVSEPAPEPDRLGFKYGLNLLLAIRFGPPLGASVYPRKVGNASSLGAWQSPIASRFSPGPGTLRASENANYYWYYSSMNHPMVKRKRRGKTDLRVH